MSLRSTRWMVRDALKDIRSLHLRILRTQSMLVALADQVDALEAKNQSGSSSNQTGSKDFAWIPPWTPCTVCGGHRDNSRHLGFAVDDHPWTPPAQGTPALQSDGDSEGRRDSSGPARAEPPTEAAYRANLGPEGHAPHDAVYAFDPSCVRCEVARQKRASNTRWSANPAYQADPDPLSTDGNDPSRPAS